LRGALLLSLPRGRLGRDSGVHKGQREILERTSIKVDKEAQLAIIQILEKAEQDVLAQLAPEQRKKAQELIGPVFIYDDLGGLKDNYFRMRQKLVQRAN
jgi:hypothetical protein